jgi:hypothetical protein
LDFFPDPRASSVVVALKSSDLTLKNLPVMAR